VVKFDYPPIKSLRQYTPPNPEDLPNLFFTEHELDQIEDDRYSTMSTDDIEIVAVSSKETSTATADDDTIDGGAPSPKNNKRNAGFSKKRSDKHEQQQHQGRGVGKSVKGRSGTPNRRRTGDDDSSKKKNNKHSTDDESTNGPRSPRRLVKGVQIYLRERSTGT